jgi:hypothetical protein
MKQVSERAAASQVGLLFALWTDSPRAGTWFPRWFMHAGQDAIFR